MLQFLAQILSTIFFLLALLHAYWARGGRWAFLEALPQKENGELALKPGPLECWMVAGALTVFGLVSLGAARILPSPLPMSWLKVGLWAFSTFFLFRAIGDFRYVGLFKKIKHTRFGLRDTRYYSPLCLLISALCLAVAELA
jgi:Protein of unknown function (DUF3995)